MSDQTKDDLTRDDLTKDDLTKDDHPKTTFLYRRQDMRREPLPNCHNGVGALDWITVLDNTTPGAPLSRKVLFIHDDILAPGVSIGVHPHDHEEYYYILSGEGVMTLDSERVPITAGDLTAIYPGGSHGLENTGETEMRIIVIGVG